MEHNFDWYDKQSTDNLLLLKNDASEQLFKLQEKPYLRKIKYWTSVFSTINLILKERNNG